MEDIDMKEVGLRLARRRGWLRWTQASLSQKTNISQTTIAQIENGNVPRVAFSTIARLAKALGLSLDSLVSEDEPSSESVPPDVELVGA